MTPEEQVLVHSHDYRLVVLSVVISILAAYAAHDLSERIRDTRGRAWLGWLAGGAVAHGIGTWSMHYTGEHPAADAEAQGIRLEVVKLPTATCGFVLLPRRWVVERNLDRHFKATCVKAQIRLGDTGKRTKKDAPIFTSDLKFHHLRHICLSWLGDTGANDMVIKAIAGHADEDVTDRYVHVSVEAMREAVMRMEQTKRVQKQGPETAADSSAEVG